jgi:hypothetical protein
MDYSRAAREAVNAMKAVREQDERLWWNEVVIALADLYPMGALGFALHQPEVWPRELRQAVRADATPVSREGFHLEDFIVVAESAALADGTQIVQEVHLARAFIEFSGAIEKLGISTEALARRVAERELGRIPTGTESRPRTVGVARISLLEERLADRELARLLQEDERGGTVDRKRSILNTDSETTLADHVKVAAGLVNSNRETPVFLIFGQDDDFTVRGEVNHAGEALTDDTVRKCQRRLDQRLQACVPPVPIKWEAVEREGKTVWIACMLGRATGTAVRTPAGAYPYRSGEDTYSAPPEMITAWIREAGNGSTEEPEDAPVHIAGSDVSDTPDEARVAGEGVVQRRALSMLRESVNTFISAPPSIPRSINGDTIGNWEPVTSPILGHFRPAIEAVVECGLASDGEHLYRLARGVRSVFRLPDARNGLTWIVEAPRLICRLIADQLLMNAYCTERWERIWDIGRPAFDSYEGRGPWVLAAEYRHPETLAHKASLANQLSFEQTRLFSGTILESGITDAEIMSGYSALSVGLALGSIAREEARRPGARRVEWAYVVPGLGDELQRWEEEPSVVDVWAQLAAEESNDFRVRLPERLANIVRTVQASGWHVSISQAAWDAVQRIAVGGGT